MEYAALGTPGAVAAAETDAKAYYAAKFDPELEASKAALLRSDTNSLLTAATAPGRHQLSSSNMAGARHLLRDRVDRQDRNTIAIQATADVIQSALTEKTATAASKAGLQFSKLATSNSVRASDFTGARHLLRDRVDRQDRNTIAIQATADVIQSALTEKSATAASKAGLQFSKLATSNSVRASDFTGARHLLRDRVDRQDRNTIAIQATADVIQSALTEKSATAASKAGLQFSKLATSNSVRASDFTGARHLLRDRVDRQDRNTIAIQATADVIQSALTEKTATAASKAGLQFSKLATSNSVRASDFTGAK
ncbi:hypothetical protein COO60DRAFT_1637652 [Scenedesmus sp. NREL 46B-D3]|nr:hypothetical protein COO60DRAFT_1637652 [Scenedesmus sp. NREL 46B-D3]